MKEAISALLLTIVSYCALVSYIPQVRKLVKEKRADGLSPTTWFIWLGSAICYTLWTILNFDFMLFLSGAIKLGFNVVILVLTLYYNHKNKVEETVKQS